jgi:type II secretory pathway pseudopilin PulG
MQHKMVGRDVWVERTRKPATAVSLFELMVVLVVGAILTVFFIYSAQYLTVSTRVSRVEHEHRVLSRALQNYEADYSTFPDMKAGLHALYGPIAYMVRIPPDPFSGRSEREYAYVSFPGGSKIRWILISLGPDHDSDVIGALSLGSAEKSLGIGPFDDRANTLSLSTEQIESVLARHTYDPTNGLVSGGDIVLVNR